MTELAYAGTELDLFRHATTWKSYWSVSIRPDISGDVLEVGAGLGVNTRLLCHAQCRSWTCLEPDRTLFGRLRDDFQRTPLPVRARYLSGTVADLPVDDRFDTILYIDVLEHIEDDRNELATSAKRLRPGGKLVVLAPAHMWLFSPFDAAIGHWRRYTRRALLEIAPPGLTLHRAFYLDSVGLLASLTNRVFLKSAAPSLSQIRFWDRYLVRASRLADPLLLSRCGKTVVAVWVAGSAPVRSQA